MFNNEKFFEAITVLVVLFSYISFARFGPDNIEIFFSLMNVISSVNTSESLLPDVFSIPLMQLKICDFDLNYYK